ncbi:hypothetical protein ILUMI_23740 [Ignelater luminosus]|uniref:Uncharacterized protein n=1 Tax=Ignelater luminosus TaxID=2038154 RepID=A0A8K0G1B4_IGNLU|nr:hypothetical protein ILUMI_23740 [Ignelater luminosus]
MDLRGLVKDYLDRKGISYPDFTDNYPGDEWCLEFLNRNKGHLSTRLANNIKRSRADVGPKIINEYFDNLAETLANVPPENIFNYDETNLVDDAGKKKVIAHRGTKHVDVIKNSTKAAVSVMFCGSVIGNILPPYTVYRAENLWSTWAAGGPKGASPQRSVLSYLKNMRHDKQERKPRKKRSKLSIEPGKSVEVPESEESEENFERIFTLSSLKIGDWIAAEYEKKWYLAVVEAEESLVCVLIKFLTPAGSALKFQWL